MVVVAMAMVILKWNQFCTRYQKHPADMRTLFVKNSVLWLLTSLVCLRTTIASVKSYESLDEGEQSLLKYLRNFSVTARPVKISSNPVEVNVTMRIVRLDAVSEKGQSIRMNLHVNYGWQNPYIVWDPKDYNGVSEVVIPEDEIWTPPIQLFNEASKSYGEYEEKKNDRTVLLTSEGICSLTYAQFFKSTCEIDVGNFPFDEQKCDLVFGSWSMDERMLSLKSLNNDKIIDEEYKINGEWDLESASLKTESKKYPIQRRKHSRIKLDFKIRRKHLYFVMNLVVPCALIACMIFLVFVLPAKSGERISLGITVMLSMAIFQELSSEKLPSSSDNFPLLGVYYSTSICEIGVALIANCFILNIFYREYEMPAWLRRLLFDKLSRLVRIDVPHNRMQHYLENFRAQQFRELDILSETTAISNANPHENENGISNGANEINFNNPIRTLCQSVSLSADPSIRVEERKLLAEDWKRAARILDRIMLILATSVGVLSFFIIFCQAPRFRQIFTI